MSDEYKVTQNSDGSYNIREASWLERSDTQKLIDCWAKALTAGGSSSPSVTYFDKAAKRWSDSGYLYNCKCDENGVTYRKRWVELTGLKAYKDNIAEVYKPLTEHNIDVPDYVTDSMHDALLLNPAGSEESLGFNYEDLRDEKWFSANNVDDVGIGRSDVDYVKMHNRKYLEKNHKIAIKSIFFLTLATICILLAALSPVILNYDRYGREGMTAFGIVFAIVGAKMLICGIAFTLQYKKLYKDLIKHLKNYDSDYIGKPIPRKEVFDRSSNSNAFKWFIYNETTNPEYQRLFCTQWTKDNPPPIVYGDDKWELYAWEKRRRLEDKEYFDCTTNTEWARNNPDTSIYSYSKAITDYMPDDYEYLFSLCYDHVKNNIVRNKKTEMDPYVLYKKYLRDEEMYCTNLVIQDKYHGRWDTFGTTTTKLNPHNKWCLRLFKDRRAKNIYLNESYHANGCFINFTCGDLYGHLQWLKRRLAEDKEFFGMLPNLKYSPYLYILLRDFSQGDELLEKPTFSDVSIGLDLQWYISKSFQDILRENLLAHSAELDAIVPFEDGGLENFDLNAAINKL